MKKLIILVAIIFGFTSSISAQNGLNFDGNDDIVQTTYSGVLGSADRTFEALVYVPSSAPASNLAIMDYGLNAVGSRNSFSVSGSRGLTFISGGVNANISSPANTVPLNQWVHVAFVLDNGTGYLYVNGVQVGTGSLTTVNTPTGNANVRIGQRVTGGTIPFHGSIDEVRMWDVVRTPNELVGNMNKELCGTYQNLKLYLQFNEGTAGGSNAGITTALDDSGNGYNGTLSNFSLTGTTSNWVTGSGITSASTTSSITQSVCDSFSLTPNSTIYTSSGVYTEVLAGANAQGCDSVVTINLTINSNSSTDVQTACSSYTWIDGNTYTANNNTATYTLTNAAGCDSVITLNLTLNNNSSTDVQTACDSYTWIDGNTYTANNNTATYTLTNAAGCDSTITLDLTINNSSSSTDVQTACGSFIWIDEITYTTSNNTATHVMPNAAGCDSTITLNLTIETVDTSVTQSGTMLSSNATGVTYQWVNCPAMTPISGATNKAYSATTDGGYAVIVTNTNQCSDTSACYTVSTVGTIENEFANSLQLFPNPTHGEFAIDMGKIYNSTSVVITDLNGQVIQSTIYNSRQLLELALEEPAGVYLVVIEAGDKRAVVRLVKQ